MLRGDIYRAPEMLEDTHFKARDAIIRVMHPRLGELWMQNVGLRLSDTPGRVISPGPELGQHDAEVFRGVLGLDDAELACLAASGAIGLVPPRAA